MASEERIKELANAIWEREGRPEGKMEEFFFRARQILDEPEAAPVAPSPPKKNKSTKRAWLIATTTVIGIVVIIVLLHIVRILPLPPVTSATPTTPPIYTPTDYGWLGKW